MATLVQPELTAGAGDLWIGPAREVWARVWRPHPTLTLSEWADKHGHLSDGQKWRTSYVPYLREVMDAVSDRAVRRVVVMKPSRVGYTEGVVHQRIGYSMHQDPERMLIVHPTGGEAEDWSRKQLEPFIRATDELSEILPEGAGTLTDKIFSGGSITIRGAHSPKVLRRHTARDVIMDEVDGFTLASGEEGDPVDLAERANRTLPDRKTIMGSTPTWVHSSRIYAALRHTTWEDYHVPCPHCHELQVLEWGGRETAHGIKWDREVFCTSCGAEASEDGPCDGCGARERDIRHDTDTAHYVCRHCSEAIGPEHKRWMIAEENGATWIPRRPGRKDRGFQISGLLSPFEGASWSAMAAKFLESKDDPLLLQVWVNQWLGEPFEERSETKAVKGLEARAEVYVSPGGERVMVPDGVGVLTAGVDVQGDRLELLIRGYGVEWESWDILHERIWGSPALPDTWGRLDALLGASYLHAAGSRLMVSACMVDSNDGNTMEYVFRYVKPRESRNIWASQGDKGKPGAPPLKRPTKANADGVKVWTIGTFPAKASLYQRLAVQRVGPRYIHLRLPGHPPICNGFDAEFFAQFEAFEKVRRRVRGSRVYEERWIQKRQRDEAPDLHVMADSALRALGAGTLAQMPQLVEAARNPAQASTGKRKRRRRVRSKGLG